MRKRWCSSSCKTTNLTAVGHGPALVAALAEMGQQWRIGSGQQQWLHLRQCLCRLWQCPRGLGCSLTIAAALSAAGQCRRWQWRATAGAAAVVVSNGATEGAIAAALAAAGQQWRSGSGSWQQQEETRFCAEKKIVRKNQSKTSQGGGGQFEMCKLVKYSNIER